jgi:type IV secretory pathway TrbF-like protein
MFHFALNTAIRPHATVVRWVSLSAILMAEWQRGEFVLEVHRIRSVPTVRMDEAGGEESVPHATTEDAAHTDTVSLRREQASPCDHRESDEQD